MSGNDSTRPELLSGARRTPLYQEPDDKPDDAPGDEAGRQGQPSPYAGSYRRDGLYVEPDQAAQRSSTATTPDAGRATGVSAPGVKATSVATQAAAEALPAQWGWRARIRHGTAGLVKLAPRDEELAHRRAITTIRQATWTRAVNVIVANPKGGTAKTPATLILAGILSDIRGGFVVAWEAAESKGSLTQRAEGEPKLGLAELLDGVEAIRTAGNLGGYTAPQTSHLDVIGSVGRRPVLTGADVVAIRQVLDTYYRITVTDTGNNPGHEAFQAALRTADAAVLPCLVSIDSLNGVEEALTEIRELGRSDFADGLASRVVVVLGHDGGPEDGEIARALRQRLQELGVARVLEVPFDPAIRQGGEITLAALSTPSRRAWTAVAAAVVETLRSAPVGTDLVRQFQVSGGAARTSSARPEETTRA